MSTGKKAEDFLQLLDNHIFFNDISDEILQFFFKVLIKKNSDHGYDENTNLVDEKLLKKKMFEYLLNDTKLLMENIPKVLMIITHSASLEESCRKDLLANLNNKIEESNKRISQSDIGDIINKQFDIFTN